MFISLIFKLRDFLTIAKLYGMQSCMVCFCDFQNKTLDLIQTSKPRFIESIASRCCYVSCYWNKYSFV